jgi:hypothetical protein
MKAAATLLVFCWLFAVHSQNVIEDRAVGPTAPPIEMSEAQVIPLIEQTNRALSPAQPAPLWKRRLATKLDRHVNEFIDGVPWMPFHHTLGISGYEVAFDHPDEMFYALALALPHLQTNTAARTRAFLTTQLEEHPPYGQQGVDHKTGRAREAYDVPTHLRVTGQGQARSAFGVYAFWKFVTVSGDSALAKRHWNAVKDRVQPLLDGDYVFDTAKRDYHRDEAEALNGNLAALIATARLARTNSDAAMERRALARTRQLLELRVNLDRVNPKILEATDSSTKHLHISKLARFCDLTPEIVDAVRTLTEGCTAARLKDFRQARNGWFIAFGDRMIGGENYTNPIHFSRALFAGAALVEKLPPEELAAFVDVPWCKGDFYFIEKCALALDAR